jgi:hypothetical protein
VRHGDGKLSTRATTLIQDSSRSEFRARSYGRSKFQESSRNTFGTPFRESQINVPFGCSLRDQPQRILYGGRCWLPPSPGRGKSCVSKCPWQVPTPNGVPNAKLTRFGWFWMQIVATTLWPSVRVKPNTWKSWRLGVFWDSRMFRVQQQGPKHLTLGCS